MDNYAMQLTRRGAFRAFLIYAISNPGSDKAKNWLVVVLFDPYHLVFPVAQEKQTKDEFMVSTFKRVKDYNETYENYFKEEFRNVQFLDVADLLN